MLNLLNLRASTFDVLRHSNVLFRLTNGIVEFDRKLSALPLRTNDRSPGPAFWATIFVFYSIFYVAMHAYVCLLLLPTSDHALILLVESFFYPPRAMDFMITVSICFYLCNFGHRFAALNAAWPLLLSVPGGPGSRPHRRTSTETAAIAETLRTSHARLCDLLRTFNSSFGPLILAMFVFLFMDIVLDTFYMLMFDDFIVGFAPCFLYVATVASIYCILSVATWTSDMKKELIKSLRSSQIVNLQYKAIVQIKLFMEQINVYEHTEMLACGMLNFKLTLLVSFMVLLITISATFIQMKNQTFFIKIFNATYYDGPWFKN